LNSVGTQQADNAPFEFFGVFGGFPLESHSGYGRQNLYPRINLSRQVARGVQVKHLAKVESKSVPEDAHWVSLSDTENIMSILHAKPVSQPGAESSYCPA
jgi:hypothetical protein